MRLEEDFTAELAELYRNEGWQVQDPQKAVSFLSFEPDLLLRKGDEYLVVEVKRTGFTSHRAVATMRKLVESHPNWRFELKLIPPSRALKASKPLARDIKERVQVAQKLATEGFSSEAYVLLWTAVEAVLHELLQAAGEGRPESTLSLLRRAYEEGAITDSELRQLQRGYEVRSRLVHGLAVANSKGDLGEFMPLAISLVNRVDESLHRSN